MTVEHHRVMEEGIEGFRSDPIGSLEEILHRKTLRRLFMKATPLRDLQSGLRKGQNPKKHKRC